MANGNELTLKIFAEVSDVQGKIDDLRKRLAGLETAFKGDVAEAVLQGLGNTLNRVAKEVEGVAIGAEKSSGSVEELAAGSAKIDKLASSVDRLAVNITATEEAAGVSAGAFNALTPAIGLAEEATRTYAEKAVSGHVRSVQAAAEARQAIDLLRASIEQAAAAGEDLGEAPAALAQLESSYQVATARAGEFRATQEQVRRELDTATRAAGGAGRSYSSLGDVIRGVNPELGDFAIRLGLASGAILVAQRAVSGVTDEIEKLAKEVAPGSQLEEGIGEVTSRIDEMTSVLGPLKAALRDGVQGLKDLSAAVLGVEVSDFFGEIETGTTALTRLADEERKAAIAHTRLVNEIRGVETALRAESDALLRAVADVEQHGDVSATTAAAIQAAVGKQIQAYESLGIRAPAALRAIAASYDELRAAAERDIPAAIRQLEALGVATPEAIREGINAIGEFIAQLPELGRVTHEQAKLVVDQLDRHIEAIKLLPPAHAEAFTAVLPQLEEYRERYRGIIVEIETATTRTVGLKESTDDLSASYNELAAAATAALGKIRKEEQEATEDLAEKQKRLAELREKPVLTPSESEELAQLFREESETQEKLTKIREQATIEQVKLTQAQADQIPLLGQLSDANAILATSVGDADSKIRLATDGIVPFGSGIDDLGDSAGDASIRFEALGTGFQVTDRLSGPLRSSLDDIAARLLETGRAAPTAADGLGEVGEQAELSADPIEQMEERLKSLETNGIASVDAVKIAVSQLKSELQAAATACEALHSCAIGPGPGGAPS